MLAGRQYCTEPATGTRTRKIEFPTIYNVRKSLSPNARFRGFTGTLIFLASAESDFVTGQTIAVDGGNVNT